MKLYLDILMKKFLSKLLTIVKESFTFDKPMKSSTFLPNLIEKHKKIHTIVCCPTCNSDLIYSNLFTVCDLPFAGLIECPNCECIGTLVNGKIIFNIDELTQPLFKSGNFSGAVQQATLYLSHDTFTPRQAWHKYQKYFWSNQESSVFTISTTALGIGITLLKHPWSGIAEIRLDGSQIAEIDLFEQAGSMQYWLPIHLGGGSHLIEIFVTGRKNKNSQDCQIHVLELELFEQNNELNPGIYYTSQNKGNNYPDCFDELLLETVSDGLVLDCGSGDRNHPDHRVVSFEYSRFQSPDIFGDGHSLPFKDNSFDLVLSQAVFEHLYDPFVAAKEIFRVLKPGGRVYVESAFMQPLHAVPYHFFNTTGWGLERLFQDFKISKITHEGELSSTLEWFYSITELRTKGFGDKIDKVLDLARELDKEISQEELKSFSSYVTLLGEKPS